jgi:signal transduction histidine kinase
MTFEVLRSFLEKKSRRCAILDQDFKILWDKDGFFKSWVKIDFPPKEAFFERKEIIIQLGSDMTKIPVSVTKTALTSGETRYVCEAYDRELVSELASKSEISELLKNYLAGINDKIHAIQFLAEECSKSSIVQEDEILLSNYRNISGASLDLLALSTNLNYYFNTFSYTDSDSRTDIFTIIDGLIKKCNELLGFPIVSFNSKSGGREVRIPERVFTVVFLNLIQNALLYSKQDSKIEVSVFYDGTNATISVTNEIAQNPPPAAESIRLGIGLPLVERIVTTVGGKVFNEQEGSTYKAHITLPLYVRSGKDETVFQKENRAFITQNDSYVKRFLNQFIEK